jgi:hypothetical protein
VIPPVRLEIPGIEVYVIDVFWRVGQTVEFGQEIVLAEGGAA